MIKVGNERCKALFDTGADSSLVSWRWFSERFKKDVLVPTTRRLLTASGQELEIMGTWRTTIQFKRRLVTTALSVIKGVSQDCIIGNDIMQKANVVLDMAKRKIKYKESEEVEQEGEIAKLSKRVTVPPRSIRKVRIRVENVKPGACCVVEQHHEEKKGEEEREVKIYPNVITLGKEMSHTIVGNVSDIPITLERGSRICKVTPINPDQLINHPGAWVVDQLVWVNRGNLAYS